MMSCLFWYTYNAGSEGAILVFPILALDIALFFVPLVGLSMLGNREWLGQSCTGYAAWTVEGHNDTLSPQWRPRDPPQWIDLMGSAYRTKPLTGPHMECEQLKIAWSMASFNMTFAFFMLLLRMAEILSMEDSLHRRYLLWTDPNKIPSLFRRIIEQDPSNPMGLLDPGRPASDASLSSFNSLFDLYLLPLNPYPRPRLEGILSIYPILSALTLHLHSTDFRALQQTSNTIKAAIRRSVGRDTSTLAKLTCSHTGRHADLFKRARCVLCDENLCRLVDRVNPVNFILPTAKRLLDQCCGTYIANFEAHAHCVRICTICFVWRKVVNWDNADLDKAPCFGTSSGGARGGGSIRVHLATECAGRIVLMGLTIRLPSEVCGVYSGVRPTRGPVFCTQHLCNDLR
ncbi:hypothetical protein BZA05DRAFT_414910 [Tricharina praecox]|uniref:uncharacterized protein n=1 Tax=Tricharina praecox TaxID=43433 RepID=UPI00221E4661|nr:uncharacterized protein BZA05DRAFT_414910 [Tricharina praecox]KAI5859204.1 hypothetical protein BZA05DRAFT_414910 [Tricharina praecox]